MKTLLAFSLGLLLSFGSCWFIALPAISYHGYLRGYSAGYERGQKDREATESKQFQEFKRQLHRLQHPELELEIQ